MSIVNKTQIKGGIFPQFFSTYITQLYKNVTKLMKIYAILLPTISCCHKSTAKVVQKMYGSNYGNHLHLNAGDFNTSTDLRKEKRNKN